MFWFKLADLPQSLFMLEMIGNDYLVQIDLSRV